MNAQCLAHAFKYLFVTARGLISKVDILKTCIHEIKIDTRGVAKPQYVSRLGVAET